MRPISVAAMFLKQFHLAFVPEGLDIKPVRMELLREEYEELQEALRSGDLRSIAQELADLVYVTYGTALAYGIDLDAALREVHSSNMSKLGEDGKPVLREDGKVLKGPNYRPPNMEEAINVG